LSEKFLLQTPEYQGPELNQFVKLGLANNDLQTALDMVVDDRIARDADKNITALISKIRSKVVGTKVALDGPGIKATNLDPLRSEALEVQAGVEGKSAVEAAKFIAKNAPTKDQRVLATAVVNRLQNLEKAGIPVSFTVAHIGDTVPVQLLKSGTRGLSNTRTYTKLAGESLKTGSVANIEVFVNGADVTGKVGTSYEIVLHELFHAVTVSTILDVGGLNDAKTNAAIAELDEILRFTKAWLGQKSVDMPNISDIEKQTLQGGNNFLDNPRELVTWAMTNRGAAEFLDTIPYRNTTALTAFVRALRKLFGLETTQDTALTELIRVTEVLLGKNAVNAAMRKVQAVEGAGYSATTLPNMASGAYIPGLNTIVLSTRTGLNEHTLTARVWARGTCTDIK
jgi:hypothetical protein